MAELYNDIIAFPQRIAYDVPPPLGNEGAAAAASDGPVADFGFRIIEKLSDEAAPAPLSPVATALTVFHGRVADHVNECLLIFLFFPGIRFGGAERLRRHKKPQNNRNFFHIDKITQKGYPERYPFCTE